MHDNRNVTTKPSTPLRSIFRWVTVICVLVGVSILRADEQLDTSVRSTLLSPQHWQQLDSAVDGGLRFLASRQQPDGSFSAPELGQPGISSLCVMAFLARGHKPGEGPYGKQLARAIDFVARTQQSDGMLFDHSVENSWQNGTAAHTGTYNHPIAGLMLCESYGVTGAEQQQRVAVAIRNAIDFSRKQQEEPKRAPEYLGGWRYLRGSSGLKNDADLSITSWHLTFLRSARNAEFDVPEKLIVDAMNYVRGSFDAQHSDFRYSRLPPGRYTNRAITGSGVLSLALGGEHQSKIARAAGDTLLRQPLLRYNRCDAFQERYHYSVYYCSQAMFQLGGHYWADYFPPLMQVLVENQQSDGSWSAESGYDRQFGNSYTTALVILALSPPYQLLPIYQR